MAEQDETARRSAQDRPPIDAQAIAGAEAVGRVVRQALAPMPFASEPQDFAAALERLAPGPERRA